MTILDAKYFSFLCKIYCCKVLMDKLGKVKIIKIRFERFI